MNGNGLPQTGHEITTLEKRLHTTSPLYVTSNDFLGIVVDTASAARRVHILYTILTPDGQLIPNRTFVTSTNTYSEDSFSIKLTEGYLVSVVATSLGNGIRRGDTYVKLTLAKDDKDPTVSYFTLASGYVTEEHDVCWPPGFHEHAVEGRGNFRSIAGTDPAAGSEISETVQDLAIWRLLSFRFTLVTSAVAATRQVHLVITDGTNIIFNIPAQTTQLLSLTRNYNAIPMGYGQAAVDSEIYISLPSELILPMGYQITTVTTALDPGDNFGAPRYVVEEWLRM